MSQPIELPNNTWVNPDHIERIHLHQDGSIISLLSGQTLEVTLAPADLIRLLWPQPKEKPSERPANAVRERPTRMHKGGHKSHRGGVSATPNSVQPRKQRSRKRKGNG